MKPDDEDLHDYEALSYEALSYDDDDGEFDPEDECMLGPDGQCGAAGSEWCDFECPLRDSELFAGSAAWNAKHNKPAR